MSIAALPPRAVRAIGSSQVLTDSTSLVKELVDNSLDAQATSITVEVSANALDVIQVKDNGHGIASVDRALVCRRHCTSKIKDLDDLARIGGASLGFRGEALASAVEMSGSVVVTTRIVGEATAVSLKVSRNGEVENEDLVSQAVGTTVRVTDFLKNLPVRRQTALKDSTKQLMKIKRNLQAYAFARPSVRLSLKVLKAKNEKGNWVYAPKSGANVSDAAVKIVGKKVSDQCQWVIWEPDKRSTPVATSISGTTKQSTNSDTTYKMEALIPKPGGDPSAICNIGQYISVDSRPVSCTRGTLKQIIQQFKSYLRSSISNHADHKVTDPFLCMNIICPPGSYDANVEPAKDDVLFANSSHILELVEAFFKSLYGELKSTEKQNASGKHAKSTQRAFELLLARKPPPKVVQDSTPDSANADSPASIPVSSKEKATYTIRVQDESSTTFHDRMNIHEDGGIGNSNHPSDEEVPYDTQTSSLRSPNGMKQTWRRSMYLEEDSDNLTDDHPSAQSQDSEDEEGLRDATVTNPWTLAKINAPIRHQQQAEKTTSIDSNHQLLTPAKGNGDLAQDLFFPSRNHGPNLPTPAKSQSTISNGHSSPDMFPYPKRAWGQARREADSSPHRSSSSEEQQTFSSGILDTWVQKTPAQNGAGGPDLFLSEQDHNLTRPRSDFVSASTLPKGTPLSAIPDISQKPRRKQQRPNNVNKPFTPPVRDLTRVWFDQFEPSSRPPKSTQPHKPQNSLAANTPIHPTSDLPSDPIISSSPPPPPSIPGLALTMDYEKRKAEAVAARRAFLRQQQSRSSTTTTNPNPSSSSSSSSATIKISPSQQPSSSPHQNRYNSAIAALRTPDATTKEAVMHPDDPRAYLMRANQNGTKRIKTALLPLETVSRIEDGEGVVRELLQRVKSDGLVEWIEEKVGEEVHGGNGFEDLEEKEIEVWEERVRGMVGRMYAGEEGEVRDLEVDVRAALQERDGGM
ncbi:MAG: hypothetical protein Q9225_001428 [Loekoesia sp. 1 TL-2023]